MKRLVLLAGLSGLLALAPSAPAEPPTPAKLSGNLSPLGPHPALTAAVAERAALIYAPGQAARCHVRGRRARCVVRDGWVDEELELRFKARWLVRLRLTRRGMVRLAG